MFWPQNSPFGNPNRIRVDFIQLWQHRSLTSTCLLPLSWLFGALSALRRTLYRTGLKRAHRLPVPTLVVGNRIAGGAGKTPSTIAILMHLQQQGWRPGVLTRGYRSKASEQGKPLILDRDSEALLSAQDTGDEPWLIWRKTQVPIAIDPIRSRGGQLLLAAHPDVNILICDDGLQHLALARDIEVIVFDERGQGNGRLLPAGPLREHIDTPATPGLCAPAIVLYNAARPSTNLAGHTSQKRTAPLVRLEDWWTRSAGPTFTPEQQGTEGVGALAGIAQPERFFEQLRTLGWRVNGIPLSDHADLSHLPWPQTVTHLIVTEKDAVKLQPSLIQQQRPQTQVWVASLEFEPASSFWTELDAALRALPSSTH